MPAYDLKIFSERLPGRRGKRKDLVYLPLSFKDFASFFGHSCPDLTLEKLQEFTLDEIETLEFKCAFMKDLFKRKPLKPTWTLF